MEIEDWPFIESCPHQPGELLTILARETSHVVLMGAGGVPYRTKCLPVRGSLPLRSGDCVVVTTVHRDRAAVERVMQGCRDGCQYVLCEYQLVSAEA